MEEEPNLHVGSVGRFDGIIWHDTVHNLLDLTESHLIEPSRTVQQGPEHDGQQHEVVILHPNHRPRLNVRQNNFGELEVGFPVRPPVLLFKVHFAGVVMEQGPKDRVGETVVVAIRDIVVEVDGLAGVLFHELLVDIRSIFGVDVETRPPDPSEGHRLFATRQGGHEATRGHLEVEFALCILGYGDWETVGDHDEMLRVCDVWDLGEVCLGGGSWNGHN